MKNNKQNQINPEFIFQTAPSAGAEVQSARAHEDLETAPEVQGNLAEEVERLSNTGEGLGEEPEGSIREISNEAVTQGTEAINEEAEKLKKIERAGKWLLGAVMAYAGYRLIRSITRSGREAQEAQGRRRGGTIGSILTLVLGASGGAMIYEAIRGRLSLSDIGDAWSSEGIKGVATLILEKTKDGAINATDDLWKWLAGILGVGIVSRARDGFEAAREGLGERREARRSRRESPGERAEQPERSRSLDELERRFGKMVPAREKIRGTAGNITQSMDRKILQPMRDDVANNPQTYIAVGGLSLHSSSVRSALSQTGGWTAERCANLAKLPLRLANAVRRSPGLAALGTIGTVLSVSAIIHHIEEEGGYLPEKDEQLVPYLKYYIEENREKLEARGIDIPGEEDLEEAFKYITNPERFEELLGSINTKTFLEAMVEAFTLREHEIPQTVSIHGLDRFERAIKRMRREDPLYEGIEAEGFTAFFRQLEVMRHLIREHEATREEPLPKEIILNEIEKLRLLASVLYIDIVEDEGGYIRWNRLDEDHNILLKEDGRPAGGPLLIDPTLSYRRQIRASERFRVEIDERWGHVLTNEVWKDVQRLGTGTAEVMRNIELNLRGGGVLLIAAGKAILVGVNEKYVLGPIEFWRESLKQIISKDFCASELAYQWGNGMIPAVAITFGSAIASGRIRRVGKWRLIGEGLAYPITGPYAAARALAGGARLHGGASWRSITQRNPSEFISSFRRGSSVTGFLAFRHSVYATGNELRGMIPSTEAGTKLRSQLITRHRGLTVQYDLLNRLKHAESSGSAARRKRYVDSAVDLIEGQLRQADRNLYDRLVRKIDSVELQRSYDVDYIRTSMVEVEKEIKRQTNILRDMETVAVRQRQVAHLEEANRILTSNEGEYRNLSESERTRRARKELSKAERSGNKLHRRWAGQITDSMRSIFTRGQLTGRGGLSSTGRARLATVEATGRAIVSIDKMSFRQLNEHISRNLERANAEISRMQAGEGLRIRESIGNINSPAEVVERMRDLKSREQRLVNNYNTRYGRALASGAPRVELERINSRFINGFERILVAQVEGAGRLQNLQRTAEFRDPSINMRSREIRDLLPGADDIDALKRAGKIPRSTDVPSSGRAMQAGMSYVRAGGRMALLLGIVYGAGAIITGSRGSGDIDVEAVREDYERRRREEEQQQNE